MDGGKQKEKPANELIALFEDLPNNSAVLGLVSKLDKLSLADRTVFGDSEYYLLNSS